MSSKVLRGDSPATPETFIWKRLPMRVDPFFSDAGLADANPGAGTGSSGSRPETRPAELERQAQIREQQALETGYRKGEAAGRAQSEAELEPLRQRLAQAVAEVSEHRRALRRQAEEDVVKLALAIARRVLRREINVDPEALAGIVKAALDRLDGREVEGVRVHPGEAEAMTRYLEQLGLPKRIKVTEDASLERGATIFETTRGELDGSIEAQLQEVQRGLCERS